MSESLILVLPEFGHLKIHKTLQELQAIWVSKCWLYRTAPEVMCRQNHCCAVDYFALGVIGYEFMLGRVIYTILVFSGLTMENRGKKLET
jgi:hypothetical protein